MSACAPVVVVKLTNFRTTEVNVSVCVAVCALAAAGASAPMVLRTTAAPVATMDLRTLMVPSLDQCGA